MEKLYFVKSIEISSRSVMKGDQTRVTPNVINLKLTFENLSFENIVIKFNKRYPNICIPKELIELRNAMAH